MKIKLKDTIKESWLNSPGEDDRPSLTREQKADILGRIAEYNKYSKAIYNENDLIEIARDLSELAENAEILTIAETEDQFDKITVTRNMKELKNLSGQFSKAATEAQSFKQRLTGLYEDMGAILNRYFDIQELQEDVSNADVIKAVDAQGEEDAEALAKTLVTLGTTPEKMNKMGSKTNDVNIMKNKLKNRNRS
jgi:hypothetical protein